LAGAVGVQGLIGYRKFIVAMAFWLSSTGLCLMGKLSGTEFVSTTALVVGLYGVANAAGKFAPTTGA
jgi:hypothetical protein